MKNKLHVLLQLIVLVTILHSCSSDNSKNNETLISSPDSLVNKMNQLNDSNSAKVFALPAPLQVVTILRNADFKYNEKLLAIHPKTKQVFPSNYLKAVNMGIQIIDIGYATVYNQRQVALDYMKSINTLSQELGLASGFDKAIATRFEKNIEKPDSLYRIILQSYAKAHDYLQANGREEIGLYVMAGSYLEGLYFSLQSPNITSNEQLVNLVGQEKLFLDNILELIQYTDENPDLFNLFEKLMALKQVFNNIDVVYPKEESTSKAIWCNATDKKITEILKKIIEIRTSFITAK